MFSFSLQRHTQPVHLKIVTQTKILSNFATQNILHSHYATRRRFERTCQSYGIYAGDKHFVRSDKYLLVLLLRPEGMEYRHRRRG